MNIQPKPYINNIKLRNSLIGNELREKTSRNYLKTLLIFQKQYPIQISIKNFNVLLMKI